MRVVSVPLEIAARTIGLSLAAAMSLQPISARSQEAAVSVGQDASSQNQGAEPQDDVLSRQRLLQLMDRVSTAPGTNLDGTPVTTTTDTWRLRGDVTFPLTSQWSVVLRG